MLRSNSWDTWGREWRWMDGWMDRKGGDWHNSTRYPSAYWAIDWRFLHFRGGSQTGQMMKYTTNHAHTH